MTLPHESYERFQVEYELDETTQAIVNEKIESLKGFPEELKKLAHSMGISEVDYDAATEEELNALLLENFQAQLGLPKLPTRPEEEEEDEVTSQEEYESFYLKIIQVKRRTGFQETKDFPIVIGDLIAGRWVYPSHYYFVKRLMWQLWRNKLLT